MEKQISIIIPTYNMEQYIAKCLDSLLIPDLDQVEVWVVNDGSKDRSSEIAHGYEARFPDSIHVLDKPNGNYGSCINAALPHCTGRYVKVLDADDTFDTGAFAEFVNILPDCDEDVILTPFEKVGIDGELIEKFRLTASGSEYIVRSEDLLEHITDSYVNMHSITYRTAILKDIDYHQTEGISYTDTQWAIIPMAYTQTVRFAEIPVYRYLVGREGQTMSDAQLVKSLGHLLEVLKPITGRYQKFEGTEKMRGVMRKLIFNRHFYVYHLAISKLNKENAQLLKAYDEHLRATSNDIYSDLDDVLYAPHSSFRIFKEYRKRNYPSEFRLPLLYRIELSLKVRFRQLLAKS